MLVAGSEARVERSVEYTFRLRYGQETTGLLFSISATDLDMTRQNG